MSLIAFLLVAIILFLLINESRPLTSVRWICNVLLLIAVILWIWGGLPGIHIR
jgi:hypothetical protein